jgi:putative SOS response-associated peptidase YedK
MCGRTALTASADDLVAAFGLDEAPPFAARYNVPPSQPLDALRAGPGSRRLERLRWGLVPTWAKDPKIGSRLALARVETVTTVNAFRDAIRRRRCLVVVDGFYEWKRDGDGSWPYFARAPDRRPFTLAGVWDRWVSRDGEVIESCAVITRPALDPVTTVHDRMPLVIEQTLRDRWLDPGLHDVEPLLAEAMAHSPALVAYPVSPYVNDPRHDDPACLLQATPAQQALFR